MSGQRVVRGLAAALMGLCVLAPAHAGAEAAPALRSFTLRQLGTKTSFQLRGVQGFFAVPFAVRSDEIVSAARLKLQYSWSPALLEDISHINVLVNDEVAASLPVPKAHAGELVHTVVEIPPQMVSAYNRLGLELVGHYARGCEDPMHTSLWASVSNDSTLELDVRPVDRGPDLKLLPQPFFDRHDASALKLAVVFAGNPQAAELNAAATVASWLGALAGYRGARFDSHVGQMPTGHALAFVIGDAALARLGLAPLQGQLTGPTVAMLANPADPAHKLLLVAGRTAHELRSAAIGLATGSQALTGPLVTLQAAAAPAPRQPYDAPNWLRSDRAVHFSELVPPETLGVTGESPDLVRVAFQVPPDLFGWRSSGIPVRLGYRYTPRPAADRSTLNVSANDHFLQALPLRSASQVRGWWARGTRWLSSANAAMGGTQARSDSQLLYVPTFELPSHNLLQMHYYFDTPRQDTCSHLPLGNVNGAIDADSTLDISGFSHMLAMPDLAAFANAGFPFTRMADLSETAVVLPTVPDASELDVYLALMGHMGAATGYPAYGVSLVAPDQVESVAGKDLIVIGRADTQPLLQRWAGYFPSAYKDAAPAGFAARVRRLLAGRLTPVRSSGMGVSAGRDADGLLIGFESPLTVGRSVVVVSGASAAGLVRIAQALIRPDMLGHIRGSTVRVGDERIDILAAGQTYQVGQLPWLTWARWFFSLHPFLLAAATLATAALVAAGLYRSLRRRAARRLDHA